MYLRIEVYKKDMSHWTNTCSKQTVQSANFHGCCTSVFTNDFEDVVNKGVLKVRIKDTNTTYVFQRQHKDTRITWGNIVVSLLLTDQLIFTCSKSTIKTLKKV